MNATRYDIAPGNTVESFDADLEDVVESKTGNWIRFEDYDELRVIFLSVVEQRDRALRWVIPHRWFWWKRRAKAAVVNWFDAHLRIPLWRIGMARCKHADRRVIRYGPRDGTAVAERCQLCGFEMEKDYS